MPAPSVYPHTQTFTGSLGAGMVGTIMEACGSVNGAALEFREGYPEWQDTLRYRVAGVPTAYDAALCLNAASLGYGSAHPTIAGLAGMGMKSPRPTNEGFLIEVEHKRPPQGSWPDGTALPMTLNVSFTEMQIPAETDADGNVVVNSAGDPFDPPQNLTIYLTRIRIVKWLSAYSLATIRTKIGKVNHADLTLVTLGTIQARCLKLLNWAPAVDLQLNNSGAVIASLFPVVFELEYRGSEPTDGSDGGYDRKIIDKGFQAWYEKGNVSGGGLAGDSSTNKGKISMKTSLQPTPQAVLLNGQGKPVLTAPYTVVDLVKPFYQFINNTQLPAYVFTGLGGTGPYYLPYRIERETDLSALASAGL